jgi:hypothetical protein
MAFVLRAISMIDFLSEGEARTIAKQLGCVRTAEKKEGEN